MPPKRLMALVTKYRNRAVYKTEKGKTYGT